LNTKRSAYLPRRSLPRAGWIRLQLRTSTRSLLHHVREFMSKELVALVSAWVEMPFAERDISAAREGFCIYRTRNVSGPVTSVKPDIPEIMVEPGFEIAAL
jgi:hypothetical protein